MEHTEAVELEAAERYLLGQMSEPEIDAFEKHFFECTACADELETGVVFQENLRAAGAAVSEPAEAKWSWLKSWWRPAFAAPAFAAMVLAGISLYQAGFVIPALRQEVAQIRAPQAVLAFAVKSVSRGEENRIVIPAGQRSFLLNLDLPDISFPSYRCDLYYGAGPALFSIDSPAPPPGSLVNLQIPITGLKPGVYTLRVRGLRDSHLGPEIAHYSFLLELP